MAKKILIIDDSALMRRVISDIINQGNEYEVAGIARDGVEGFDMIVSKPNEYSAIILDINMPKMNGLELLEKLAKNKIEQTVIVVSTVAKQGAKETIRALELGAFDFVTKPENYLETKGEAFKNQIHQMLDLATGSSAAAQKNSISKSSVMRRTPEKTKVSKSAASVSASVAATNEALLAYRRRTQQMNQKAEKVCADRYVGVKSGKNKLIALACSTGGPKSLQQVVPFIPKNIDAPMVIVQHMPAGFTASLAQRLNEMSEVEVKEATDKEKLKKGTVYIAPGGRHLRINKNGSDYCIALSDEPSIDGLRPCANLMYESLKTCAFDDVVCVVLTGMGADGTKGIKSLADSNKKIHVIAQNEDTCVVYGMPKAIAQAGLVDEVVPLQQVAETITKNVGVS